MDIVLMVLLGYLIGSVPTGYLLGSLSGVDVRAAGSGNVGATNVARVVGKSQGVLTLIGDAAKGYIPVFFAIQFQLGPAPSSLIAAAAFLGHLYPVFLKFQGGKGVATALGVLLGLAPLATLILIFIFTGVALTSRIVSLSSMLAAVAAPFALWMLSYPPSLTGMSLFLAIMIILRHRDNIRRLRARTEPKFGF